MNKMEYSHLHPVYKKGEPESKDRIGDAVDHLWNKKWQRKVNELIRQNRSILDGNLEPQDIDEVAVEEETYYKKYDEDGMEEQPICDEYSLISMNGGEMDLGIINQCLRKYSLFRTLLRSYNEEFGGDLIKQVVEIKGDTLEDLDRIHSTVSKELKPLGVTLEFLN